MASHVKSSVNPVVELIVAGEVQYREPILGRQQWLIECKSGIEEEARRRKEEEECRPREREIKAQKERIERLLNEASVLRQSADIRANVEVVRAANVWPATRCPRGLAEADRMDPIQSGRFLDAIKSGSDG